MTNMTISQFINSFATKDRDKLVLNEINNYYNFNSEALADGLYTKFLVVGPALNKKLLDLYNVPNSELSEFRKNNKELKKGYAIANDTLKLCLLASYAKTKDRTFLDFLGIMFAGAKFAHYFRFKENKLHEMTMRYTLEKEISGKSFIKKTGTLYGAIQELISSMLESPITRKNIDAMGEKDDKLIGMLGRLKSVINDMLKRLKSNYEKVKEKNKIVGFNKDIEIDNSRLEMDSNSSFVKSIMYLIDDYNPKNIDYDIMRLLGLNKGEYRHVFNSIITEAEKPYFHIYAEVFIKYYMKNYYTTINDFLNNFIPKMTTARMNDPEVNAINDELAKLIITYGSAYKDLYPEEEVELNKLVNAYKFNKTFRNYVIIKIRRLANDL